MRFTSQSQSGRTSLDDEFYCRGKRRVVRLMDCLDDYVEATAMEKRRSACFRCPHGRMKREAYAASGDSD